MKMRKIGFVLLASLGISACSPQIYVIDRHNILEEEAAGEWPDFEKELIEKSKERGPTAFEKTYTSQRKKRLYNVLNGEMVSQAKK